MSLRNFSSVAVATTLTAGINSSVTSMAVAATTGFPAAPFTMTIDTDTVNEEIVLVTAVVGLTLTITRGYDSSVAVAHSSGASARHTVAGIDFREANSHVNASVNVHGVTGSVVGTTDIQTLTNKTLTAPAIAGGTLTGTLTNSGTISGGTVNATTLQQGGVAALTTAHNVASGVHGIAGSVVGTTDVQTLTSKSLTAPAIAGGTLTGTLTSTGTLSGGTVASASVTSATIDAASTIGGVSGTTLASIVAAMTAYTPTFGNVTSGAGTFKWLQIGKILFLRFRFTGGTATAGGVITITLPNSLTANGAQNVIGVISAAAADMFQINNASGILTLSSFTAASAVTGTGGFLMLEVN